MLQPWKPIADLHSFPSLGAEESEQLDFKREPWGTTNAEKLELLRDIAQFANHLGGTIVVGAVEDGGNRLVSFASVADAAAVAQRVRDVSHDRLSPRPELESLVFRGPNGGDLVVINVQPVPGVVAIRVGERWEFYRRYGKGKKPITFDEVEKMWSAGRRGRLVLFNIPNEQRSRVFLDMQVSNPALTRRPGSIRLNEDHFEVKLANVSMNFPYEFVRAAWPSGDGGWVVSLTARLYVDDSGAMLSGYSP